MATRYLRNNGPKMIIFVLSAQYLKRGWMDLLYIHTVDSYGQGEELIRFWARSVAMATRYLKKMGQK